MCVNVEVIIVIIACDCVVVVFLWFAELLSWTNGSVFGSSIKRMHMCNL